MKAQMIKHASLFFKGFGIGAANVIPGVSGGTIALITGILERLVDAIKSIDVEAIRMLMSGRFRDFSEKVSLLFLVSVFLGAIASIFTLARILEFLFLNYPVFVWAYFFGLIVASAFFVGRTIDHWNSGIVFFFLAGTVIASGIAFFNPATENENFFYLILCGVVAVCSMILPGLSGSFVMILLGNYELVAIEAINELRMDILFPVFIGIVVGLISFSHFLSWIYKSFRQQTLASLTGFIVGSLFILWPWKHPVYKIDDSGNPLMKDSGEIIIQGYDRYIPDHISHEVIISVLLIILGMLSIWLIERLSGKLDNEFQV
jgi:putative membrane protein